MTDRKLTEMLDTEAIARERGRRAAPTTCALADVLFRLQRERGGNALEDLAVLVEADSYRGVEYSQETVARVIDQAATIATTQEVSR